jgi:hypothetical protein
MLYRLIVHACYLRPSTVLGNISDAGLAVTNYYINIYLQTSELELDVLIQGWGLRAVIVAKAIIETISLREEVRRAPLEGVRCAARRERDNAFLPQHRASPIVAGLTDRSVLRHGDGMPTLASERHVPSTSILAGIVQRTFVS